ncbi:MAG: signal peptidase I [Clostridiales bacterium]|nr:signal peptidase I [Clostridiales bacterium]
MTGKPRKGWKAGLFSWLRSFAGAGLAALLVTTLLALPIRVQGGSMDGTLRDGDMLLVTRPQALLGSFQRGDVVICEYPGRSRTTSLRLGAQLDMGLTSHTLFVKRLMGLPGDTIEVRGGHVYLDGQLVDEPYIDSDKWGGRAYGPHTLGEDEYFVIGDNRASSHDSRYPEVGPISGDMIVGHPKLVLFPLNRIGAVY